MLDLLELPYNDYFEYFAPSYHLHIEPSNSENQNDREYLQNVQYVYAVNRRAYTQRFREHVLENLRKLPAVPSVQMQRT